MIIYLVDNNKEENIDNEKSENEDVEKIEIKLKDTNEKIFRKNENEDKDKNSSFMINKTLAKKRSTTFYIIEFTYDIIQKKEKK